MKMLMTNLWKEGPLYFDRNGGSGVSFDGEILSVRMIAVEKGLDKNADRFLSDHLYMRQIYAKPLFRNFSLEEKTIQLKICSIFKSYLYVISSCKGVAL